MELPMFYNEVEEWNRALLLYDAALKEINTKLEILNNEFKLAHQYNPIEHITSRVKSLQSIAKKIRRKNKELTVENIVKYVNDVAGVRIICSFASDIYRIADLITKQNDVTVLKVKDYIVSPKPNGYMSYHMIVTIPIFLANDVVETKVEVQIRTIAMDFWASLEHKIYYKFEGNAPAHIREDLKECAQLVSYLDKKMLMINDEVRALEQGDYDEEEYQRKSQTTYFESVKDYYGKLDEEEGTEVIIEHEEVSEKAESEETGSLEIIELPKKDTPGKAIPEEESLAGASELIEMPEYIGTPEDIGIERWGSLAVFLENRRRAKYSKCEISSAQRVCPAGSE